jgi:hypothetical protein
MNSLRRIRAQDLKVIRLSIAALNIGHTVTRRSDCRVCARASADSVKIAVKPGPPSQHPVRTSAGGQDVEQQHRLAGATSEPPSGHPLRWASERRRHGVRAVLATELRGALAKLSGWSSRRVVSAAARAAATAPSERNVRNV